MTAYGQSVPAAPQVYVDQAGYNFTKAGFTSHLCRALASVGMVPILSAWQYDALDPTNAEFPDDGPTEYLFPFDFPDTSTFTLNSGTEQWRPFLMVASWINASNAVATRAWEYFYVDVGIRRAGAFSWAEQYSRRKANGRVTTNFGWVSGGLTFDQGGSGGTAGNPNVAGARFTLTNWMTYDGSVGGAPDVARLQVRNFLIYLGRAGLFLYVGSGNTQEAQFGDILSCGFVFAGTRIPGREPMGVDANLARINPVVPLWMREGGGIGGNQSGTREYDVWPDIAPGVGTFFSQTHGIQHDLKSTLESVYARCYALENLDFPIFPGYGPVVTPSPRDTGAGPAHILSRLILVPEGRVHTRIDLYGPVVPELSGTEPRPQWEDVFTAPGFRFTDSTAPLGEHTDSSTGTEWRIVPMYNTTGRLALYYEGAVEFSVLGVGTRTEISDVQQDMSVDDGLALPSFNITVAGNGSGDVAGQWQSTNSVDIQFISPAAIAATQLWQLDWTITIPGGDTPDTLYEIFFEARNESGTVGTNPFDIWVSVGGVFTNGWITPLTASGSPGGSFTSYQIPVVRDGTSDPDAPIILRWEATGQPSIGGNTVTIQNVHLIKSKYL
jgi:hypothetical protein